MYRRPYFVFADRRQAQPAVTDLTQTGIKRDPVHALARANIDLGSLPPAASSQRRDLARHVENALWRGNLALFALSLLGLLAGTYLSITALSLLAIAVMLLTFVSGVLFAHRVPDTYLDEFRGALAHGDIVLLVDAPRRRHAEVKEMMRHRHPEAVPDGGSWTIDGISI